MGEQTRPSAIVGRPEPDQSIADCTTAELLHEAATRASAHRAALSDADFPAGQVGLIAREYAEAITHIEDAITRHNKAVYMERGVFAITDAERTGA